MYIIEPCCAARNLMLLRDAIGKSGTAAFKGFGDLSLTELLPAILTRYSETDVIIVAPSIPDQAADVIGLWMRQQRSRRDGSGKLDVVRHMTIIADLHRKKSPQASLWVKDNPFEGRLTLVSRQQADTAILLPDFAVTGPVNMRYGHEFIADVTTKADAVTALWKQYLAMTGEEVPEKEDEEEVKADAAPLKEDEEEEVKTDATPLDMKEEREADVSDE